MPWTEIDDETGETDIRIIGKDTEAAIRLSTIDLTTYSSSKYRIVLTDGAAASVWGWIGEADAAEALGANLAPAACCTDPDDDQDVTTGWTLYLSSLDSIAGGQTGNCLEVTKDGVGNGLGYNEMTIVDGVLYKMGVYAKLVDATNLLVRLGYAGAGTAYYDSGAVTPAAFTLYTAYATARTSLNAKMRVYGTAGAGIGGTIALFDDVTLKQVTHLGTDAVHIYTTQGNTVQSWNGAQATFDWNDVATLEIEEWRHQGEGGQSNLRISLTL